MIYLVCPFVEKINSGGSIYNKKISQHSNSNAPILLIETNSESLIDIINSIPEKSKVLVDSLLIPSFFKLNLNKIYETYGLIHLPSSFGKKDTVLFEFEKSCYQKIPIIVTGTQMKDYLITKFNLKNENIKVVLPGIENYKVKTKYAQTPSKLICNSNLIPLKNGLELVEILNLLKQYSWQLNWYGAMDLDPNYSEKVISKIKNYQLEGKIILKGNTSQSNLFKALQSSDLLIHPSSFESFSMSIYEAIAIELPFISLEIGEITLFKNSKRGILNSNLELLSSNLNELLNKPSAYKKLCHKNNSKLVRKWDAVYQELITFIF